MKCERCSYLLNKISNLDNQRNSIGTLINNRENRLREQRLAEVHNDSIRVCVQLLEDSILTYTEIQEKLRKIHLKLINHYGKVHSHD